MLRMQFLHRTVFEYAQSIGDTFGAISGGEFEYFPCQTLLRLVQGDGKAIINYSLKIFLTSEVLELAA